MNKITERLDLLRSLDKNFSVFDAKEHQYAFNKKISESEISEFEQQYKITLPEDYRAFILHFGNGGCGPYYGLFKLETGIYDLPQNQKESEIIKLDAPFRFSTFWNLTELAQDYDLWESQYDLCKWCAGMLRIGHIGSGAFINLVVSGEERGNIWIDDRVSEGGIYPNDYHNGRNSTSFLQWYIQWIEQSIERLKDR